MNIFNSPEALSKKPFSKSYNTESNPTISIFNKFIFRIFGKIIPLVIDLFLLFLFVLYNAVQLDLISPPTKYLQRCFDLENIAYNL